jgi:predicted nucleic acid-binding protein
VTALFLDASYAIALASPADAHHRRALELASEIEKRRPRLVTTRAVTVEIGNGLSKKKYRGTAARILRAIEEDTRIEVLPLSEDLYVRAFEFYHRHDDKEWGMTDCTSFVVMKERGIQDALTTDHHFLQAGFRALLLSS